MQQAPNRRVVGRGHIRQRERVDAAIAQQRVLVAKQLAVFKVGGFQREPEGSETNVSETKGTAIRAQKKSRG